MYTDSAHEILRNYLRTFKKTKKSQFQKKVGTGRTKQEAKNNAARDIVVEIEKLTAQQLSQFRVIGSGNKIKKNAVALLHVST